jgi:hypothetical protein
LVPFKNQAKKKTYNRRFNKRWYAKNQRKRRAEIAQRRNELVAWFHELKTLKCNRCPETHWACLDFHHLDPTQKDTNLAQAANNGWSKERILAEIAKCEVLCKNCHVKEHHPLTLQTAAFA